MQSILDFLIGFKNSLIDNIIYDFLKWLIFFFVFWSIKKLLDLMKSCWKYLSPKHKRFMKNHMQWFSNLMRKIEKWVKRRK